MGRRTGTTRYVKFVSFGYRMPLSRESQNTHVISTFSHDRHVRLFYQAPLLLKTAEDWNLKLKVWLREQNSYKSNWRSCKLYLEYIHSWVTTDCLTENCFKICSFQDANDSIRIKSKMLEDQTESIRQLKKVRSFEVSMSSIRILNCQHDEGSKWNMNLIVGCCNQRVFSIFCSLLRTSLIF